MDAEGKPGDQAGDEDVWISVMRGVGWNPIHFVPLEAEEKQLADRSKVGSKGKMPTKQKLFGFTLSSWVARDAVIEMGKSGGETSLETSRYLDRFIQPAGLGLEPKCPFRPNMLVSVRKSPEGKELRRFLVNI